MGRFEAEMTERRTSVRSRHFGLPLPVYGSALNVRNRELELS